ncbi:MAG: hypothetical protein NTV34_07990, partial [Proteobacteria bacterium]|nr:hypothetical protein [Pseudomonadota bacterium]
SRSIGALGEHFELALTEIKGSQAGIRHHSTIQDKYVSKIGAARKNSMEYQSNMMEFTKICQTYAEADSNVAHHFNVLTVATDRVSRFLTRHSIDAEQGVALVQSGIDSLRALSIETYNVIKTVSELRAAIPINMDESPTSTPNYAFKGEISHQLKIITASANTLAESAVPDVIETPLKTTNLSPPDATKTPEVA